MLHMDGSKNSSRLKRGRPVAPSPWRIVPPPQRFSTRIGCIQSAVDFREFSPTAAGFLLGPLSPASLMRRVHSASSSLRERRIGTDQRPAVSSVRRNVEWLLSDEHSSVVTGAIWPGVGRGRLAAKWRYRPQAAVQLVTQFSARTPLGGIESAAPCLPEQGFHVEPPGSLTQVVVPVRRDEGTYGSILRKVVAYRTR
jgi:hypothetical protein